MTMISIKINSYQPVSFCSKINCFLKLFLRCSLTMSKYCCCPTVNNLHEFYCINGSINYKLLGNLQTRVFTVIWNSFRNDKKPTHGPTDAHIISSLVGKLSH